MNIMASYLFNRNKFMSFMEYLSMTGVSRPDSFDIINDIGRRGIFLESAVLKRSASTPTMTEHYVIEKQIECNYKEVYLPSVGGLEISSFKRDAFIIEKMYVQTKAFSQDVFVLVPSRGSSKIVVKELHISDIPHLFISDHCLCKVNIHSNIRAIMLITGCKAINLDDAKNVIAVTSVGNLINIFKNTAQKLKPTDRKAMYSITKGSWKEIEDKDIDSIALHQSIYGEWFIGNAGTLIHPEDIPNTVWRTMKAEAKKLLNNNN